MIGCDKERIFQLLNYHSMTFLWKWNFSDEEIEPEVLVRPLLWKPTQSQQRSPVKTLHFSNGDRYYLRCERPSGRPSSSPSPYLPQWCQPLYQDSLQYWACDCDQLSLAPTSRWHPLCPALPVCQSERKNIFLFLLTWTALSRAKVSARALPAALSWFA